MDKRPKKKLGQRLTEWLQRTAFKLIAEGSSGMARSIVLGGLHKEGIHPTKDQIEEIESEMKAKGERFAQIIMERNHGNPIEPSFRKKSNDRAILAPDHSLVRGPKEISSGVERPESINPQRRGKGAG